MTWNWQKPEWPKFSWDSQVLTTLEAEFMLQSGIVIGSVSHLNDEDRDDLNIQVMSTEAITTSEIEGEILNRASVQSSVRRLLGLADDGHRVSPAEQGIAEMMVSLYRSSAESLDHEKLLSWHQMLFRSRLDAREVGCYRTHPEPMQVISGPIHDPRVHFEAPPANQVPDEMAKFVAWFNRTGPQGATPLAPLARAGIAHLYFVSIHPFEDGNGRIGRAISEKALAQSTNQGVITGLAATISRQRKAYYLALEAANKELDITDWLVWFAKIAADSQKRTVKESAFLVSKARLLDRLRGQLNPRQEKALLRMFREGIDGFKGGLSASNYVTITGGAPATTTRDLADLVAKGALLRTGTYRHARYHLALK